MPATAENRPGAAAVNESRGGRRALEKRFALAGFAGGIGLWMSVAQQWPVLGAIAIGAVAMAWLARRRDAGVTTPAPPWRLWGQAGAATTLGAWLLDTFPGELWPFRFEVVNPVFALAWLGAGELLARVLPLMRGGRLGRDPRAIILMILAVVALVAPFVLAWQSNGVGLPADAASDRLTNLPDGVVAAHVRDWLRRDGWSGALWATLLPAGIAMPAMALLALSKKRTASTDALILALAAGALAVVIACSQLRWWTICGAVMLAAVPAITRAVLARSDAAFRNTWLALMGGALLAGAVQIFPKSIADDKTLTALELQGLIERELGYWLASRSEPGKAIVLAPPSRTTSLAYYGGIRGLGTTAWENRAGRAAAIRMASAGRPDEALALLERRGVTHIVIPSWDSSLDDYARIGSPRPEDTFIAALQQWSIPAWLRPVPYSLPAIPGFEQQYVLVFETGTDDGEAVGLSRLVDYCLETERAQLAASAAIVLKRYPGDLSGLAALAQQAIVNKDRDGFLRTVELMTPALANGQDSFLPFDRQVNLGIVLAQAKRTERARVVIERCLRAATAADLRALTPASLYRLHVTAKALNVDWPDRALQAYARQIVPREYRSRLP